MSYLGNSPGLVTQRLVNTFTATASQTTFTTTSTYVVGYVDVYVNGVKLNTADFVASSGSTVVLAEPCVSGDIVDILLYFPRALTDGYTKPEADLLFQPLDGDLTSIAGLVGTSGFLKKSNANTWTLDTNNYLTSFTEADTLSTVTGRGATTATAVTITNNTSSTNTSTGALIITGGVGIGGDLYTNHIKSNNNTNLQLTPGGTGLVVLNTPGTIKALLEGVTISATAATGTINYDAATQSVLYYTSNATANWTLNLRGSGTLSLNTLMATGQSLTVAFLVQQGGTAYYPTTLQVDGTSVTPKWQGGTAPTSGNTNSIDVYTYTIIKTANATYTVLASQTKFT